MIPWILGVALSAIAFDLSQATEATPPAFARPWADSGSSFLGRGGIDAVLCDA
jgi:hypothetical protein